MVMENSNAKAINTKEVKIVRVGAGLNDGQKRILHTASCDCGCRVYVANKKESLAYTEKLTAKCCGSKLHYTGQKQVEGDTITDPYLKEVKKETTVNPKWLQPKNNLVRAGKRGITNQGMIEALLDAGTDETRLTELFNTYPDTFISSAKYLKDSLKDLFETIIHTNPAYAKVSIPRRKKIEG
jgi:hypothetical protein